MQTTETTAPRARKARTSAPASVPSKTKKDQFVDLLRAKAGSDVKALSDALGWQPHTVRAALTGLRKAGITVEKLPARDGELTRYRINAKRGPRRAMTDDPIRKEVELLSASSRQELLLRWEQLNGSPAPEGLSTSLLRRGVIYDVQAMAYGGLSPARRKALLQIAASKTAAPPASMKAGARLVREWNGVAHVVDIVDGGLKYRDKTYASLTAIAKEITGAHWSGPRFFGIKGKAQ